MYLFEQKGAAAQITDSGSNLNCVPTNKGEATFYSKSFCLGSQLSPFI